jgi:hypothetical protein
VTFDKLFWVIDKVLYVQHKRLEDIEYEALVPAKVDDVRKLVKKIDKTSTGDYEKFTYCLNILRVLLPKHLWVLRANDAVWKNPKVGTQLMISVV